MAHPLFFCKLSFANSLQGGGVSRNINYRRVPFRSYFKSLAKVLSFFPKHLLNRKQLTIFYPYF